MKLAIKRGRVSSARTNGRLCCGSPRSVALGIFGALTKLKSAANDLPYTSQVAPGLFGQSNAQASKVAHWLAYRVCHSEYGAVLFDDDRFYIIYTCVQRYSPLSSRLSALLSHVILSDCRFLWRVLNCHPSGVLTALFWGYMAGAS